MGVSERILLCLRQPDPDVRILALEEVAQTPDPDSLALLIEGLADLHPRVAGRARDLLKSLTGHDMGPKKDVWREWWATYASRRCARCGRHLFGTRLYYLAKLDLTSEPREIWLSDEDLARDHQAEIERLVEELRRRPPEDVQEEVLVHLEYYLCLACKKALVKEVREGSRT